MTIMDLLPDLKGKGNPEKIKSPFRDEKDPSFAYYPDKETWYDFGEGIGGDIYALYMRLHNCNFAEAKKAIDGTNGSAAKNDSIITRSEHDEARKLFKKNLPKFLFTRWEKRKIDPDIIYSFDIGVRSRNGTYKGGFYIPFKKNANGNIILAKEIYWSGNSKKQRWIRGSKSIKINGIIGVRTNLFQKSENVILAEGEEDFFSLVSNGYAAATGVNGATTFKKEWAEYFVNKNVFIVYDNDQAGIDGALKAAAVLYDTAKSIKIVKPFEDRKKGYDIGDWFTENDPEHFADILEAGEIYVPKTENVKDEVQENKKENKKESLKDIFYTEKQRLLHTEVAKYVSKNYQIIATEPGNKVVFYLYHKGQYEKISNYELSGMIDKLLYFDYTDSQIRSVRNILASKIFVKERFINDYPTYINLNNCTYDLDKYLPITHDAKHYFTYKNPYDFNSNAQCPKFDDVLKKFSLGSQNWINCLWEIIGYCLTGTYELQKMFWFTGSQGGNGKGTVTRVMMKLCGLENTKPNFSPEKLGENFYKKSLMGKRLAIAGDMPGFLSNIASIKELTGGDRQSTDVKYSDSVDFENTAKLVFAMNSLPVFSANEPIKPILRRICLLPFDYVITDYDTNIEKELEAELPGIFNKAIQGLKRLRANGEFTKVNRSEKILNAWLGEYNTFNSFIEEKVCFDKKAYVWNYDLWKCYLDYMDEIAGPGWANDRKNVKTINKFTEKLRQAAESKGEYFSKTNKYSMDKGRVCGMYYGVREMRYSDYKIDPEENDNQINFEDEDPPF